MEEKENGSLRIAVEACLGDGTQVAERAGRATDGAGAGLANSAAREVAELGHEWASMNELVACQIAEFHVLTLNTRVDLLR